MKSSRSGLRKGPSNSSAKTCTADCFNRLNVAKRWMDCQDLSRAALAATDKREWPWPSLSRTIQACLSACPAEKLPRLAVINLSIKSIASGLTSKGAPFLVKAPTSTCELFLNNLFSACLGEPTHPRRVDCCSKACIKRQVASKSRQKSLDLDAIPKSAICTTLSSRRPSYCSIMLAGTRSPCETHILCKYLKARRPCSIKPALAASV
mmetsp:Transcript_17767/g.41215  ORF Transcript_17767/g.41215 Transcript_17767/m.41215 type:complete len:208 (+) Transcript_17767:1100-1723(+)